MRKVKFRNGPIDMAGNLHLPEDFSENRKYAAIVCVHPSGGVKEQTGGLYAEKLAKEGFVTLAYDASYQGESGGRTAPARRPLCATKPEETFALPNADLAEAFEYYRTPRAQHCNSPSRFTTRSLAQLVKLSPFYKANL